MNAQGIESLAQAGRFGDTELIHATKGEVVIPPTIFRNKSLADQIKKELAKENTTLEEITVGSAIAPINPGTGLQEFFLKKLFKKVKKGVSSLWKGVKKVIDPVAQVARFIPGPWRIPANIYVKGKAAVNLVKGEGGIGDLATLFTGNKLFGETGDLANFAEKGFSLGKGGYTLGNLREGIGQFMDNPLQQIVPSFGGQNTETVEGGVQPEGEVQMTGQTDAQGNPTFIDRLGNIFNTAGQIIQGVGAFNKSIQENTGINPGLLLLAKKYGDATERALEKESGGMGDIRQSLRPDLAYSTYGGIGGFDLGYAEGGEVMDMRAGGESIGPGTGTSDDIPAMLSDGEFVMTAKANLGAGSVGLKKGKGGIMELVPQGEPDRQRGADNMMKLMRYFEAKA
jgi:hypothetical protein